MSEPDLSQEFSSPDINLLILLREMESELKSMQLDIANMKSPIIKGYAQRIYLEYKYKYFTLLAKDLELLKLYETTNEDLEEQSSDGFTPM